MSRRTRTFAATLVPGLAAALLAAVAGTRAWAEATGEAAGVVATVPVTGSDVAPVFGALALVCLAGWGALLVLRGRARTVLAVVGVAAAAGEVVALVLADPTGAAADSLRHRGPTGDAIAVELTGWYAVSWASALVTAAAFGVAVLAAHRWPAMGSRYDAPTAPPASGGDTDEPSEEDLWRAIDRGHDPTS